MTRPDIDALKPGDVIELKGIGELTAFEDLLAGAIDPYHNSRVWANRKRLSDLIRPKAKGITFNGSICNIKLIAMADPYERLLDAVDRGWKGQHLPGGSIGAGHKLSPEGEELLKPRYKGFVMTADTISSKPGDLGQLQAELWYFPSRTVKPGRTTVSRAATLPVFEKERLIELDENSRRVGFDVLRQAMIHPISTPMRD